MVFETFWQGEDEKSCVSLNLILRNIGTNYPVNPPPSLSCSCPPGNTNKCGMTSKLLTKGSGQILAVLQLLCLVCLASHKTDLAFKAILRKDITREWFNYRQMCHLVHLVNNPGGGVGVWKKSCTFFSSFFCGSGMCLSSI